MSVQVSSDVILNLVCELLKFNSPKICRHYVAMNLLDLLEQSGLKISDDLAKFTIESEDDKALEIINNFYLKQKDNYVCSN